MIRSKTALPLVGLAGLFAFTTPSRADDFAPPTYRGQPLSTRSSWEFLQPPANFFDIAADSFTSVAGPPQYPLFSNFGAEAEVDSSANWMWTSGDGDGGLTLTPGTSSAFIGFKIPNFVDDLEQKLLRVQITYQTIIPIATPDVTQVTAWFGFGGNIGPVQGVEAGSALVSTTHYYEDWTIAPNPSWELIDVALLQGMVLDEVVIDTISIPAPGGVTMLSAAGLLALRRRR